MVYEISGIASSSALDGENYSGSSTFFDGSWESGSVSTSQTHTALIGYAASESGAISSLTWDTGWGNTLSQTDHSHYSAFRAVTSSGSYSASGTNTGTTNGLAIILALKAASL